MRSARTPPGARSMRLIETGVRFVEVMSGDGVGWVNAAYLTDYSRIPESSYDLLRDLEVVFLDALRHEPHPAHCTVEQALEHVERIKPRRAFFTHIAHDLSHAETDATLPEHVRLSYDGLQLEIEL